MQPGDTIADIAERYGVPTAELIAINGISDVDNVLIGQRLLVPMAGGQAAAVPATVSGPIIPGIPAYQQARSLSCEYASVFIATSAFGNPIYEDDYLWSIPESDNPHYGYRGNIDGAWGNTDDYGIYAEALVPMLESRGYVGEVSYGADADYLQAQIDAGHPVIVWIATRGDTGFYETGADGASFKLVPYEHVVVAYGYDDAGVYVSDPGFGGLEQLSWDWFLSAWNVMDGMSLAVYPAA